MKSLRTTNRRRRRKKVSASWQLFRAGCRYIGTLTIVDTSSTDAKDGAASWWGSIS